uniref:RpiB/LacA/LacB family sugar-phosphate isomerase n=1 Tax=Staphylococcus aureus TaxID=1280 RepID=UPI0038B2F197
LTAADAVNARSINNSNVLAVSGMSTSPEYGVQIVDAWLNTPFKAPCPASDFKPWPEEMVTFLDNSVAEMSTISSSSAA